VERCSENEVRLFDIGTAFQQHVDCGDVSRSCRVVQRAGSANRGAYRYPDCQ
jgi:hypothetical protein